MSLKNKFCSKPFEYLEVGSIRDGRMPCFACCPQLVTEEMGDFTQQDVDEIWNSPQYQKLRESIHDGSFKYCNKDDCPEIQTDALPDKRTILEPELWDIIKNKKTKLERGPKVLNLDYDQTCNLSCPSCRVDLINHNNSDEYKLISETGEKLKKQALKDATDIIFCSSGDPFASKHFRTFMGELDFKEYPNLKVQIVSNGVLFTEKTWDSFKNLHGHIGLICISLDAAREETYAITRRGGNWPILMKNLEFLGKLRAKGEFEKLRLDFVVQDFNFREMPELVDIGLKVGADEVFFQKIVDWSTYSPVDFKKRLIYSEQHPKYEEFIEVLQDQRLKNKIVNPGNFGSYLEKRRENSAFNWRNAVKHTFIKRWRSITLLFK